MSHRINELFILILGLILVSVIISMTGADLKMANFFYQENNQWPGITNPLWATIYNFAPWPALLIGALALFLLLMGIWQKKVQKWRQPACFMILLLALGPGLVVNVILKDNLGRARPREVMEFGGSHSFTQIWEHGTTGKNSSFPSGHASIAFALIGPWFILRGSEKKTAAVILILGLTAGGVVGFARILQGGHFLSDVLWAGGLVYLVGGLLALFFSFPENLLNLNPGPDSSP